MSEGDVRTLVVDDSLVMRKALRGILEKHGYTVTGETGNGLEAIRLYKELRPELVTLDIIMPQVNGVETLRIIKTQYPDAHIVMVTAMTSMNKVKECAKFGAEHYIVKPFDESKIVEVLKKVFPDRTR